MRLLTFFPGDSKTQTDHGTQFDTQTRHENTPQHSYHLFYKHPLEQCLKSEVILITEYTPNS